MSWREAADGGGGTRDTVADTQPDETRRNTDAAAERLLLGQRVQARVRGVVHWTGTVERISVLLGVVWIREDGLGERRLLDLREYEIHPQDPTDE